MTVEKKSSDVLLDLDKKIDLILGHLKTNDLNNKLILNRLNQLIIAKPNADVGIEQVRTQPINMEPIKPTAMPRAEAFITSTSKSVSSMSGARTPSAPITFIDINSEDNDPNALKQEIQLELQPKGQRRDIRTPLGVDKKIPVQQKVLYPDGKAVILANIEIQDMNKVLIKKTRTNNVGKWATTLDPGQYIIHIQKTGTAEKPAVERTFEVTIPTSETPIELDLLK